jgi:hypothetical protein
MTLRLTCSLLTASLLAVAFLGAADRDSAAGAPAAPKKDLTVTLKITDKASGFNSEAKKLVAADTNPFDLLRHTRSRWRTRPTCTAAPGNSRSSRPSVAPERGRCRIDNNGRVVECA